MSGESNALGAPDRGGHVARRRDWPAPLASLLPGVLLAWLLGACQPAAPPAPAVAPPPDLAELDLAVREQFHELWGEPGEDTATTIASARRDWGALAQWFHVYRYPDSAERAYRAAMLRQPEDPRWPYLLALLLAEGGDSEAAEALLQQALALAPQAPQVQLQLADLARRQGRLAQAEQGYRAVLILRPGDAGARFGLGQLALQRGDSATAIEWLQALAEDQPKAAELNYALGTAWRMHGDEARARQALARVPASNLHQLPLQRDDPWLAAMQAMDRGSRLLTRRGVLAARAGDHARAAVLFGAAVRSDPDGAEERLNWALALAQLGRHEAALAQIEAALARSTEGSDLWLRVRTEQARLLTQAGQPALAETRLAALLAQYPEQQRARLELARLLHTRGDLATALTHYGVLRQQGQSGPELAFWQAAALLALPDRVAASQLLQSELQLQPGQQRLDLLQWRLLATAQPADGAAARAGLQALRKLAATPNVLQAETLAMLLAATGDHAGAAQWQQATVAALQQQAEEQRALADALHIARRRLALYREGKQPLKAWEPAERPLPLRVTAPPVD